MKIDIDKLTKQMFERMRLELLSESYSGPVVDIMTFDNHKLITKELAQQIALDAEIEKVKYGQDLLIWSLGGVGNKENVEIIHNKIRKFDQQLAGLNRLKEEL